MPTWLVHHSVLWRSVAKDSTTAKTSASVTSAGGQVQVSDVVQLTVPPASVPPGGIQIDLSTVTSPFMDFLFSPHSGDPFTPLPARKIRVKGSDTACRWRAIEPLMPGLGRMIPAGQDIGLLSPDHTSRLGGEQIVNLTRSVEATAAITMPPGVTLLPGNGLRQ